ncbi:MAG: RNA polymerase sigma factor [Armatimonadota bacterium]
MLDDAVLLNAYAQTRDAEAFAELVRRYAGLVYGTCLRVTRNPDEAEDAAQECFIELAKRAGSITGSLPGWLHATARHKAIDGLRKASTRREYEGQAIEMAMQRDTTWDDIMPHVDEALAALPEELRAPILLHFLEGRTQAETAAALGVNQSTVSRRLEKGLEALRGQLKHSGVMVSLAALAVLLSEHAAVAAPPSLITTLGKMAIAGFHGSAAVPLALLFTTLAGKLALVLLIAALLTAGLVVYRHYTIAATQGKATCTQQAYVTDEVVAQAKKVLASLGPMRLLIDKQDDNPCPEALRSLMGKELA